MRAHCIVSPDLEHFVMGRWKERIMVSLWSSAFVQWAQVMC